MAHIGCPILGDDKYGGKSDPFLRLGLHAHALEFIHPESGEVVRVVASCPPIFHSLF
jgi:23S rRNA pseudouridine1911/1915/1917 synthase